MLVLEGVNVDAFALFTLSFYRLLFLVIRKHLK